MMPSPDPAAPSSARRLVVFSAFVLIGMTVLFLGLWTLRSLFIVTFAAILLGVLLSAAGDALHRWTRLPRTAAVILSTLLIVVVVIGVGALMAPILEEQVKRLVTEIPSAVDALQSRIGKTPWLNDAWENLRSQLSLPEPSAAMTQAGNVLGFVSSSFSNLILILFAGLFLALSPDDYVGGTVRLVPPRQRDFATGLMKELGHTLRAWAGGQLLMMVIVGVVIGLGLWAIGVPNAFALGVFAGLTEFIPYLGPILGAAPAVLLGLTQSPTEALWVVGLFLVVQQIEGNILQPAVQKSAVEIPPAILVIALFGLGELFGLSGLLVATPLVAVIIVLVKRIYVERILEGKDEQPTG